MPSTRLLGAIASTLLIASGCASSGLDPALNGRWRQAPVQCENGNDGPGMILAKRGKPREADESVTEIRGSTVVTRHRYWKSSNRSGPACEWTGSERWIRQPDGGFVIFSDSNESERSAQARCGVKSTDSNGLVEYHYELKDGKLLVFMGNPRHCDSEELKTVTGVAVSICGCGSRPLFIYEREEAH